MQIQEFFKNNFEKISQYITIILFSEIFTIIFLLVPATFLTISFFLFIFYLLFFIFILVSIIVPWIYTFFSDNDKKYLHIFSTSFIGFLLILIINLYFSIYIQVILYSIILKSLIVGLASIFKSILMLFDNRENNKNFDFNFKNEKQMNLNLKINKYKKFHKNAILGGIFFLFVYPLVILIMTYFYAFIKI